MAGQLPGNPSHHEIGRSSAGNYMKKEPLSFTGKWYFTKEEIEEHSPSRKDGISHKDESHLRKLYCSFLQELGMELKVPQVTIATAMLFCHRFYMRQSHAKNYWQTIATASMFLASKAEETPRWLSDLVAVAYRLANKWDPLAPQKIRQRDIYDQQKETILLGERLLLATLAFDLNVEHPYKPLVAAVKKLEIPQKELVKVAWNFVNDWLRTTMCLQYKPHYIAAGSLFLAAKLQKVKLPKTEGKVWWMQFDVSPKQLEDIIQHMLRLLEQNQKQELPPGVTKMTESKSVTSGKATYNSPESCISNCSVAVQVSNLSLLDSQQASTYAHSMCCQEQRCSDINDNIKETEVCQISDCGSANSTVEDGDIELKMGQSDQISGIKHASSDASYTNIDVHRIKERLKMRRLASANSTVEDGDIELKMGQSGPSSGIKHATSDAAYNILDVHRIKERIKMRRLASANSSVEDGDIELKMGQYDQITGIKHASSDASYNIDVHRIKERLKMRRLAGCRAKKLDIDNDFEMDNEAWIEKELESGVELSASPEMRKSC